MIRLLIGICFLITSPSIVCAQYHEPDMRHVRGFSIGIEDGNSGMLDYGFASGFHVNAKHSLMISGLSSQSWRIGCSKCLEHKFLQLTLNPFVTSDWNASFANAGCAVKLSSKFRDDLFKIGAEFIPYYDSGLKYHTGWALAIHTVLQKDIAIFSEYCRKPEYRFAYQRIFIGLEVNVINLTVKPMLEVPIYDSCFRPNHSRILISAFYTFQSNRN